MFSASGQTRLRPIRTLSLGNVAPFRNVRVVSSTQFFVDGSVDTQLARIQAQHWICTIRHETLDDGGLWVLQFKYVEP